jgi:threonine dehydratase
MARDLLGLTTEIVGVQSSEAPAYALSLLAGRVVTTPTSDTRADGVATRVPDPDAFQVIRRGVSRIVLASDEQVANAVRAYWTDTHNLAEGAGAAALAAAILERDRNVGRRVALILSGGNIDLALFADWVMAGAQNATSLRAPTPPHGRTASA